MKVATKRQRKITTMAKTKEMKQIIKDKINKLKIEKINIKKKWIF